MSDPEDRFEMLIAAIGAVLFMVVVLYSLLKIASKLPQ